MHAHEIARRMHKLDTKVTLARLSYDFQLDAVSATAHAVPAAGLC